MVNRDAENAVISAGMTDNKALSLILEQLNVNDFGTVLCQTIYRVLSDMYASDDVIDLVTVAEKLEAIGEIEAVGGITGLTALYNSFSSLEGLQSHIDIVKDTAERRYLCQVCDTIKARAIDKTAELLDVRGEAIEKLGRTLHAEAEDKTADIIQSYEEMMADGSAGLKTTFSDLDNILDGLRKGNLIVLAGRPSMGKTAFAVNLIAKICEQGSKVLFASLEMSKKEIYQRFFLYASGLSMAEIKRQKALDNAVKVNDPPDREARAKASQEFWQRLLTGVEIVQRWDLELIKAGGCSVEDIMLKAKALKQKQGLDMIVIDYLQLMTAAGYQNNRVAEISFITRRLKLMAESLELPLVILSQLSRAVETRNDKHPILADLRDSGSIEQDADVVMFIYRDSYYTERGDDWTEVIVKKNRQGGKGTARFNFLMDRCRFTPYTGIVGEKANRSEKAQAKEAFE